MRYFSLFSRLIKSGLFLFLALGDVVYTPAQAINQWAPPQPIPDYVNLRAPILVADQNKTVHAFYNEPLDRTTDVFYYRKWNLEQGWTQQIDFMMVLLSVNNPIQSVFLDHSGMFHLIYHGDLDTDGNIYYTRAPAYQAERATSWSKPLLIGPGSGPVLAAQLLGDGQNNLVVLYSGQEAGIGLYEIHSNNGGDSWTEPRVVTLLDRADLWPYSIRMLLDREGHYHAVWSLVGSRGVGLGVYYSRLSADLSSWTHPFELATLEAGEYSTQWPAIIDDRDYLIIVYQDSFPATKFIRVSPDGGDTWNEPVRPFPHTGEYENPVMMKDGDLTIHMVLGNRIGNPEIHGMWHSVWQGERWSELQPVIAGPNTSTFDPSSPNAVIVQGNILFVSWRNDVADAGPAMYSYIILDATELPVVPLQMPDTRITSTLIPSELIAETPTPLHRTVLTPFPDQEDLFLSGGPAIPVFVALIPVILISIMFVILQRRRNF